MSEDKPSFIKIAKGAKVSGLTATDNTVIGNAYFINNEGFIEDATLERNTHITAYQTAEKRWFEKPIGLVSIGVFVTVVGGGILYSFGWH
jgi:hypothetical protein